jgi:hypothetical protein
MRKKGHHRRLAEQPGILDVQNLSGAREGCWTRERVERGKRGGRNWGKIEVIMPAPFWRMSVATLDRPVDLGVITTLGTVVHDSRHPVSPPPLHLQSSLF